MEAGQLSWTLPSDVSNESITLPDSIGEGHQTVALLPSWQGESVRYLSGRACLDQDRNIGPCASKSAWQNHVAKLTEKERVLFLGSQSEDIGKYVAVIEATSKEQEKNSRGIKIAEKLEPLVNALNMYAPIANTLIQADPSPSAFVLGGITCILSIPSRFLQYQVNIVEMLSEMGKKMALLSRYEKEIYQNDAQVQKSLIDLYGDVLDFCREASKLLYDENGSPRGTVKTFKKSIWEPYQSSLGAIAKRFERDLGIFEASAAFADRRDGKVFRAMATQAMMHHCQDNQNVMGTLSFMGERMLVDAQRSQMQESAAMEVELRRTREEKRNRVLAWIPSVPFVSEHHDKLSKCLPGTGKWLLEHHSLKAWESNTDSDILVVEGGPGCGKSCLAALVIDKLQKEAEGSDGNTAVAFVYCSSKINPSQLRASILKQLCSQVPNPGIIPAIEKMFDKNQGELPTPDQLEEAIPAVSASFNQTFIVVDGLDECHRLEDDNFDRFCNFLRSLAHAMPSVVKVMIFSRPGYPATDQAFRSYTRLVVDSGANEGDIKSFIVVSGEQLHIRRNQALLKYVEEELLLKAKGMFLWVALLVKTLRTARTANEIKAKMKALPQGLPGVYEFSLRRILDQKDESSRERALKILLWVTNAKRALSKEELAEALAIEPGVRNWDEGNLVEGDEGITAECGDLIVLRDGNYHLLHSSLQDYLSNLPLLSSDHLYDYRVMQTKADRILGEACLTYLQLDKFETGPLRSTAEIEEFQRSNPFFKYAASYWGRHVAAASEDGFLDTIKAFVSSDKLRDLSMQQFLLTTIDPDLVCPYSGSTTPLHILSVFNLVRVAESIPDVLQMKHIRDGLHCLPLHYALIEKSKDMCLWMLQEPDHPADASTGPWLPLYLAARNDWGEVIERLISLGHDPELRSGKLKQTPLHAAAGLGCKSAVNALLKAKVSVDPIDARDYTPLLDAAEGNHHEVVSLLLRAGAQVNHRGRQEHTTALHFVAINGNLLAARELLQYGSEVDPRAGQWKSLTPLHVAAENNRTEVVRLLLSKNAQIEAKDNHNSTPLLRASLSGSLASLDLLISSGACVDARDVGGQTALHLAARNGHLDVCVALLMGRDGLMNAVDDDGDLPLHSAIRGNQTEIAISLLKRGCSAEKPNAMGQTALHLAIIEGNTDLVERLIMEYKASLTAKTSLGSTPLHIASQFGHTRYIKWLIDNNHAVAGALNDSLQSALHIASREKDLVFIKELARLVPHLDFAPLDKWDQSPLHYAANVGSADIVSFLLERRVPSSKDSDNNLPLHLAAWNGHLDVVKLLLTEENINARGFFGRTTSFGAASRGNLELVSFLLCSGANPNERDEFNQGPLITALKNKHSQVAELLLDNAADPHSADKFGRTPLHEAAESGDSKLTKRLLKQGCDGLHKSIWGSTPFECAVSSNRVDLIDVFLEHGYNGSNVSNSGRHTAYHVAASNGNVNMFEKLIEAGRAVGADPCAADLWGRNALSYAASGGHVELLDRLVELGMSVNQPDRVMGPPILDAAAHGNLDFVSRLLELKADVQMFRSKDKWTPLIAAAASGRPKIFQKLLSSGADPLHRDVYGLNALDYAFRRPEIWETLDEAKRGYEPLNPSTRKTTLQKTILQDTIRTHTSSLLKLSAKPTLEEEAARVVLMTTLAYALLALADHEAALVCFSELANPIDTCYPVAHWQCGICMQERFSGSKYVCTQCHGVELCQGCHSDYLRRTQVPESAPRGLRVLEKLEKDLQPIRRIAWPCILLGATCLDDALGILVAVNDWIEEKLKEWNKWEQEFNSEQRFNAEFFPGGKFLKLIEKTRQIREALQNKPEDSGRSRREDEAESSDNGTERNSGKSADEMSKENEEEGRDPFSEVNESLIQLFIASRPDKEVSPFACSGHDYLEVPSINWTETKSSTGPFDVNGRVTKEWLNELLTRYTNSQVLGSRALSTEPSEREMNDDHAMKMPIRTTTISRLDGDLQSTPTTILNPPETAVASPESQIVGSSEQIIANQRRIQAIKEELFSSVARVLRLIFTPSDDGRDNESNEDSEELNMTLVTVVILEHESAFQFLQVVLLGGVTQMLFSKDTIQNLLQRGTLEDANPGSTDGERGDKQLRADQVQEVFEEDEKGLETTVSGEEPKSTDDS